MAAAVDAHPEYHTQRPHALLTCCYRAGWSCLVDCERFPVARHVRDRHHDRLCHAARGQLAGSLPAAGAGRAAGHPRRNRPRRAVFRHTHPRCGPGGPAFSANSAQHRSITCVFHPSRPTGEGMAGAGPCVLAWVAAADHHQPSAQLHEICDGFLRCCGQKYP